MRLSILKFEGALLGALSRARAVRTRSGAARFASLRTCAWLPSAAPPALVVVPPRSLLPTLTEQIGKTGKIHYIYWF